MILLGVYVLGGLRGRQKSPVRTHLGRCTRCRGEYEELADVPALLDLITREEAAAGTGCLIWPTLAMEKTGEPADDRAGARVRRFPDNPAESGPA